MSRHVAARLAPYWEGLLSAAEAREVEAHLAGCSRCRRASEEVATGVTAARSLESDAMPDELAARIRRAAERPAARPASHRPRVLAAAAGLAVLAAGGLLLWARSRPHVDLEAETGPPAPFEELARAAHRRAFREAEPFEIATSDAVALREWARRRTGLQPSLATRRGTQEERRYRLMGARTVEGNGFTAAAIAFRVDEKPVTLLVARAENVPEAPSWDLLGKRVRWRQDPETGAKLLTWTNSGLAYTLVSELPGGGQQACLVCHTDPKRQALIASLDAQLKPHP